MVDSGHKIDKGLETVSYDQKIKPTDADIDAESEPTEGDEPNGEEVIDPRD